MRLLKGSLLFAAYIVLPIAVAYAHQPPLPCSACGLKAPEFDLTGMISGTALCVGAVLLFLDRFRGKR
jgi:hypothetical protein